MHATDTTRDFKVAVILALEESGAGFDTRFRFYRNQFPDMTSAELARMICDPVEFYDKDWQGYLSNKGAGRDEEEVLTEFILERDRRFRDAARAAIYSYDEAGFGSGVNSMRFLRDGKPILGFYNPESKKTGANLTNIIQLGYENPQLVTLVRYLSLGEIPPKVVAWLGEVAGG